jgi:DNA-binding LytR/AlgR family response regulator
MIGAIPISLITLFLRNRMLKDNLGNAIRANAELEKIKNLKRETSPSLKANQQPITLRSETTEILTLNLPDLLFIQADDNYSTVYLKSETGVQKKILRIKLRSLDEQINNPYAIRCHRSFIVNVNAISNITGNTNGYKLQILDSDLFIPVSRQKGRDIIEKIQQVRSMMELS